MMVKKSLLYSRSSWIASGNYISSFLLRFNSMKDSYSLFMIMYIHARYAHRACNDGRNKVCPCSVHVVCVTIRCLTCLTSVCSYFSNSFSCVLVRNVSWKLWERKTRYEVVLGLLRLLRVNSDGSELISSESVLSRGFLSQELSIFRSRVGCKMCGTNMWIMQIA